MEAFAGLGLVATEIFRYNRQNFAFDQDQRFNRDELRFKMQVERFRLFRQDIRDLVELTVQKMDLYHMTGALFIRMISIYYSEGFFFRAPTNLLASGLLPLAGLCSGLFVDGYLAFDACLDQVP